MPDAVRPHTPPGPSCARCGHVHETRYHTLACDGHKSRRDPDGNLQPCSRAPMAGQAKCATHGGKAPQTRAAAGRRLEEQAAEAALHRGLAAAYGTQVPDIDPAEAMLQAVAWKHAEVIALRMKVAELARADEEALVWGITREKHGGQDFGTTQEARPNVWLVMLTEAQRDDVKFAAAARAAGCDERRVQLAEQQGDLVVGVINHILDGLYAHLIAAGIAADILLAAWRAAIADVVPRELRAAALGGAA